MKDRTGSDSSKRVYFFGQDEAEGSAGMKDLLGGKGAGLAEMTKLGIPVPPGMTITTEVCREFYRCDRTLPEGLESEIGGTLKRVEKAMGATFGDAQNPLLLSVRSGARASMPGMMDTILNLGLNDRIVQGLAARSGSPRFAYDSYRRFIAMYAGVVLDVGPETKEDIDPFERLIEKKREARGATSDSELLGEDLKELVEEYKAVVLARTGKPFPEAPMDQLLGAVRAVFNSWENDRAIAYRQLHRIPSDWGTAVTVQSMVFGNTGQDSASGVCFTRNPATGEGEVYGEFLVNAQGEDVVAGIRTPWRIGEMARLFPDAHQRLVSVCERLEGHFGDMQDIEFTIENGRLFILQCRNGKRTGFASVRIAADMVEEGIITKEQALSRIDPEAINHLLRPVFDASERQAAAGDSRLLAKGLPAGPGAASGKVVFFAEDAVKAAAAGESVILCRHETSPEDIRGMNAAAGFLTAFGGMTSHAALVARQMGRVAVVGCGKLHFDYQNRIIHVDTSVGDRVLRQGDWISLDGFTGEVFAGHIKTAPSEVIRVVVEKTLPPEQAPTYRRYAKLLGWADEVRRLKVLANADQADQASAAVAFGAEGIGLCRTEHMFFGEGKIGPMREMIVAETKEERATALAKLLPRQRRDFADLFRVMAGRPVTIRTLDPPLHEFLPQDEAGIGNLARATGRTVLQIEARIASLRETNPMLGLRGCRLGISHPEITEMQAQAIFEAACDVAGEGIPVHPEVMIPLVGTKKELDLQAQVVHQVAERVFGARGTKVEYAVGTMIEVPRAALTAGEIAQSADFFSFGTNDLTQMTFGLSRDDVGKVLADYVAHEVYPVDPFVSLDRTGVGELIRIAVTNGRKTNPDLGLGICGEHGGDPESVKLCDELGLDYVSCSAYRLPIARLAAAQAALECRESKSRAL